MYERVLLPLDGSKMAEQALPHAAAQARQFGAELVLLRIIEPFPQLQGIAPASLAAVRQQTDDWTRAYFDRLTDTDYLQDIAVKTAVVEGRPGIAILQYADTNNVDLIVLCSRGRSGLSRWLLGSTAERIMRGATVPVLLVRAQNVDEEEGA